MSTSNLTNALNPNSQTANTISQAASTDRPEFSVLNPQQKTLTKMAFESAVEPYRQGFQKRLDTTLEGLASRGVLFGGVGNTNVSDLVKSEQEQETNIAKSLASQLGQTALDQAYSTNERLAQQQFSKEQAATSQQYNLQTLGQQQEYQKEFANLSLQNQMKLQDFTQGLQNGINPTTGKAYNQTELQQQLTNINTQAQKDYATFTQALTKGTNPITGQAYNEKELSDLAYQRSLDQAQKQNDFNLKYQKDLMALQNGVNEQGQPLTQIEANIKQTNALNAIQRENDKQAVDDAMISAFGADGVAINKALTEANSAVLQKIMKDPTLNDTQRAALMTPLINGESPYTEKFQTLLRDNAPSLSGTLAQKPEPKGFLEKFAAGSDLVDVLNKEYGFEKSTGSYGMFSGNYGYIAPTEANIKNFNDLWNNNTKFKETILANNR